MIGDDVSKDTNIFGGSKVITQHGATRTELWGGLQELEERPVE